MTFRTHASFSAPALLLASALINVGGIALLSAWSEPASAAPASEPIAPDACAPLSAAQHQVLDAAANGVDALRDHLWMRRGIRGFDLIGTAQWIDAYRLQSAACGTGVAQAGADAPPPRGERAHDATEVADSSR